MNEAWHSRAVCAVIGRILPVLVALGCTANAPGEQSTAREREATFANGDFEDGTEGAAPPSWLVTPYSNHGVTYPPLSRADLNLQGDSSFNTVTHVGAGPEMEVDPQLGADTAFRWPKYGTKAVIVNENIARYHANGLTQTQTIAAADVDPNDGKAHVRFAVAPVLENPNHSAREQPYYFVELRNLTKGTILYHDFNASAQPGVPWKISTQGRGAYYTDWQLVDIAPGNAGLAVGDQVELEVIAAGCAQGGHQGHVWVDGVGGKVPGLFVSAVGPAAQNAGENITYTLSYTNGGTAGAGGVKVHFTTPPNTTWVGLDAPGLTCTEPVAGATGLVECEIGNLAPGSTGAFQVTVKIAPSATGTITNGNYSILGGGLNPLIGPKVYTTITANTVYADLSLTKSNGLAGLAWGQSVAYALRVTNQGPAAVSGATVTDVMPAEILGASWSCAGAGGGICGAPSGTGDLSATVDLPVGASATFTVTANVMFANGTGSVTNTASVSAPSGITDSNPSNNIDADTDAIGDLLAVTVSKLGVGFGSVVSSPTAINCGPSCTSQSGAFVTGSELALNAVADSGYVFTGWGGDCASAGIAAQCSLTLSASVSVTASFGDRLTYDGGTCELDAECDNGLCVDGVCCDSLCTGTCEACDVSGKEGKCSPATGAPHGARTACTANPTVCGSACNGTNRTDCIVPPPGTVCRAAACTAGVATARAVCDSSEGCPPPSTNVCAPFVCGGTACMSYCYYPGQCAVDNHCTGYYCVPNLPVGGACSYAAECLSGNCIDGFCCDTTCTDQCAACDVSNFEGTCTPVSGPPHGSRPACTTDDSECGGDCDGTTTNACAYPDTDVACREGSCVADVATLAATCHATGTCPAVQTQPCLTFSCGTGVCLGGCTEDVNCSADNFCAGGMCVPTLPVATPCAGDNQCASAHCVDDVCCDTACDAQCEACDVTDEVGTCTAVSGAPHGVRIVCESDGSECGGACDGDTRESCAYPSDSVECREASCTGVTATLAASCDGLGACPGVEALACAPFSCGATACLSECEGDTDCDSGNYCSANACVPTLDPATVCTADNQCASTHCADGVCCDTACTGQCEACNESDTLGSCTAVSGAPRGARSACDTDDSACGGACDGTTPTACAYPGSSVVCLAASCADGIATLSSTCDSAGGCSPPQFQPCSPFICGNNACAGDCATATDCALSAYCSAGICVSLLVQGAACGADDQCLSEHCVDGVCCDSACTEQCEACDGAAALGVCTAISGEPHGARPSCDGTGDCGPTCDGVVAESCTSPSTGTECAAATCVDGAARAASLCDGSGVCVTGEATSCGDYGCSEAACLSACKSTADCADGRSCVAKRCVEGGGEAGAGNATGGNGNAGEPSTSGRGGTGASGGAGGKGGSAATGGTSGTGGRAGTAGSSAVTVPGVPTNPGSTFEGGGCSCRILGGNRAGNAGYLLAALGAVALLARRRKVARSHRESLHRTQVGSTRLGVALVVGLLALFYATTAHARGFELDRFDPSERGSRFFSADSLELTGANRLAVGVVGDYAHKPLVLRDASGNEIAPVISEQFFVHAGASIVLLNRVRVGLNLPLLVFQDASAVIGPTGPVSPSNNPTVGDVRLSGDVRLFGKADEVVTVALGVRVYFPTGSPSAFTSDGWFSVLPQARVAGRISAFVYAADFGVSVRADRDFARQPLGPELVFGGAAGVIALHDRLVVGPELWASTVISDQSKGFFGRTSTPVEMALGAHYDVVKALRIGAGVGHGFSSGMGSPEARFLMSVEWVPPVEEPLPPQPQLQPPLPNPDRDSDGIEDSADACPDAIGPASTELAKNGCPLPVDTDADGIADPSDACPKEPGHASEDPQRNGCPLPVAPPPPADSDADGVLDANDACPAQAGSPNTDPKQNGCPRAIVAAGEITILDRVEFEPGKAELRAESDAILTAVATVLKDHPELTRLSVEGHTDDRGVPAQNIGLSQRRAAAVVAWLVAHGIEASRLTSNGFGAARPLDSNGTEAGRQTNRRVEFKIVGGAGAKKSAP